MNYIAVTTVDGILDFKEKQCLCFVNKTLNSHKALVDFRKIASKNDELV